MRLIAVADRVVLATSAREAERALLLMLDGADGELRGAVTAALEAVRAEQAEPAA